MKNTVTIRFLCLAVFWLLCSGALAEDKTHHRVGLNGAVTSSDSWLLEFSYHYMFNRYVGLGGSVGTWKVYFEDGRASGQNWSIDGDDNKPWNFYLRPSVLLKTPAIKYRASLWSLFAEPGLMLNIPYQRVCIENTSNWPYIDYDYISTNKGQWIAIDLRIGVSLDIGPIGINAGYMMSNLDVYSQYRHLSYNGNSFKKFYPKKPFMQGAYISCSYNF